MKAGKASLGLLLAAAVRVGVVGLGKRWRGWARLAVVGRGGERRRTHPWPGGGVVADGRRKRRVGGEELGIEEIVGVDDAVDDAGGIGEGANRLSVSSAREGDVQMAMSEGVAGEVQADAVEGLSLRLVPRQTVGVLKSRNQSMPITGVMRRIGTLSGNWVRVTVMPWPVGEKRNVIRGMA